MLGFVDDNNITNNGEEWETIRDIIVRTQQDAQLWNDLLRATGGALNLDKCFAQVLAFQFGLNGAPVIAPVDPNLTITLQDRLYNKEVIIRPILHIRRIEALAQNKERAKIKHNSTKNSRRSQGHTIGNLRVRQ
jgi:hypothetical protein